MKKCFVLILVVLFSCQVESVTPPCIGGCNAFTVLLDAKKDNNGYYHQSIVSNSYFTMYVEATDIIPEYRYNGMSVIEGWFDTDTYWQLEDSIAFIIPLYKGFTGLKSSPYWTATPLAIGNKTVYLSQYAGMLVPIVQQNTRTYFQRYETNLIGYNSEYKPQEGNLWSKRIIGPISIGMKNDTIQIFTKVIWEAGSQTIEKNDIITKIIIE